MKKYLLLFLFLLFSSCAFCLELSDSEAQRLQEIFLQLEKLNQDSKTQLMQAEQRAENLEISLHQAEQKVENLETLLEENNIQMQQLKSSYKKEKTSLIVSNVVLVLGIIGVIIFI